MREMCQRAPLIMSEDLLRDLVQYKQHRVRSVSMAAQSLIHVYRISMPMLLHKRDRVSCKSFEIFHHRSSLLTTFMGYRADRMRQVLKSKRDSMENLMLKNSFPELKLFWKKRKMTANRRYFAKDRDGSL